MSNPVIQALLFGKALAEVLKEKIEDTLTNALSEIGKFDAEQREKLNQFLEEVKTRAEKEANQTNTPSSTLSNHDTGDTPGDLQEVIDELRAQIASLRSELKNHRNKP